jgi:single-strand DNA-binding protein
VLNLIVLIGRLTRDPELRHTGSGVAVAHFTLAVDRPYTNQQGERDTDFIDVSCWRELAETVAQHLQKGRLVAVQGSLHIRRYETPDGQQRRAAEVNASQVRFLDRPREAGAAMAAGPARDEEPGGDEDVPF